MSAIPMMKRFAALLAVAAGAAEAAPPPPVTTWFHNDLTGSPVAATNEAGQVIWREGYYPFGERLLGPLTDNRVWFTSRRQDPETGLIYMGARYYDPVAGRFLQPDPVHFVETNVHSFNRYAYANNNPYRHTDPDGRQAVPILVPPPSAAVTLQIGVAGKPSHAQQIRALEGFATGPPMPTVSTPGMIVEVLNFVNGGGFAGIVAGRLSNLVFSDSAKKFSDEKQALVEMAKRDQRSGITPGDMEAYKDLNAGLVDRFPDEKVRGPEAHATGAPHSRRLHGHVGPVDHIPIVEKTP